MLPSRQIISLHCIRTKILAFRTNGMSSRRCFSSYISKPKRSLFVPYHSSFSIPCRFIGNLKPTMGHAPKFLDPKHAAQILSSTSLGSQTKAYPKAGCLDSSPYKAPNALPKPLRLNSILDNVQKTRPDLLSKKTLTTIPRITNGHHPRDASYSSSELYDACSNTKTVVLIQKLTVNELNAKLQNKPSVFRSLFSGKIYTPTVHEETTCNSFTKEQIQFLLRDRGLLIENKHGNSVTFTTQSGGTISVRTHKNGIRLSGFGVAYHDKIVEKSFIFYDGLHHNLSKIVLNDADLAIVKLRKDGCLVESPGLTHIVYGYTVSPYFYISGVLTSTKKGSSEIISEIQFFGYTQQKKCKVEESCMTPTDKPQSFIEKDSFHVTELSHVEFLAYSKDYLQRVFKTQLEYFAELLERHKQIPVVLFDHVGVTPQEGLDMCLNMDYNSAKSQSHAKTLGHIYPNAFNE